MVFEADEVGRIAAVEIQAVRMRGGSDQQVSQSASRLATHPRYGRDDESVAANCSAVERNRFKSGFDLLQPALSLCCLNG